MNEWLPNPGYMPVDAATPVMVMFNTGEIVSSLTAGNWDWEEEGEYGIEKYRVIKKEKE